MGEQRTRRVRWIGAGIAVVVAAAVGVSVALLGHGSAGSSDLVVGSGSVRAGQVPPSFSGTAIDGRRFDLAAERGHVVVVNFFATWCENCRAELPLLQRTWEERHGAGLDVVTVDFNDSGDARAFLKPYGVRFPALLDPSSRVGHAYLVSDLPVSFFIGRDGRIVRVFHGQLSPPTLADALRESGLA